jgi:hypothetical protein
MNWASHHDSIGAVAECRTALILLLLGLHPGTEWEVPWYIRVLWFAFRTIWGANLFTADALAVRQSPEELWRCLHNICCLSVART